MFLFDSCVFSAPGEPRAAPGAPQGVPEALQTLLGGPNGASREPPGVLLERSWRLLRRSRGALDGSWRLLAAPRALPGRFWRSSGARLEPWDLILKPFFPEALCFWVLRHRSRNRHRLFNLRFSSGVSGLGLRSGVLRFSSRVLGFSLGFSSGVLGFDSGVSTLGSSTL